MEKRLKIDALDMRAFTLIEDGKTYLQIEVKTDRPGPLSHLKMRAVVSPLLAHPRKDPPLIDTAFEIMKQISRSLAVENHIDNPAVLLAHGITPEVIEEYKRQGWRHHEDPSPSPDESPGV